MPGINKWFDELAPDVTVQAALHTLWAQRFAALAHYLNRLATETSPAVETIHQLRVWARRTTAVLDLFAPTEGSPAWRSLRKSLKKIRRWAGEVRDYDVLWERMRKADPALEKDLLDLWKRRRRLARKRLTAQVQEKALLREGPKILKQAAKQILKLEPPERNQAFQALVRSKLQANIQAWSQQGQRKLMDPAELHQFRIEGKRLRYALEIVASVLPGKHVRLIYKDLSTLHEQLGQICDIRAAVERYLELRDEASRDVRKSLSALVRKERRTLGRVVRKFLQAWTPQVRQTWVARFQELVSDE